MKSLLQPSSDTWCSKFWTGSSHFQACRLSPGTIRLFNQGNQRGSFQPFHAWGLSLGSAWLWELLKWPEIGNDINRKLMHKGDQEWAQQACRALGLGENLLQLALGSSKCREEGFSGHWVSGKTIHVASPLAESQPRAFGTCQRLIRGF